MAVYSLKGGHDEPGYSVHVLVRLPHYWRQAREDTTMIDIWAAVGLAGIVAWVVGLWYLLGGFRR